MREIRPQPGAQEKFLSTSADICIYGGAAGGGKTWGLLLEPLRHINNSQFSAVIFRRTTKQARNPGGLWDESSNLYPLVGGQSREAYLEWGFPSGAIIKFAHMEHEKNKLDWQGSQIPLIAFDELTHFTKSQFFYMLSRNRSTSGIRPYIRATTNPDADSWVSEFIAWWIDQDTGYPIPERSGVLRWFIISGESTLWANSKEELVEQYPDCTPKSVTFISASIYDNKVLLEKDPGYLANLKALPRVEQERLLGGNWKIRPSAGLYFNRAQVEIVDAVPADISWVRCWDLAATEKTQNNDPDWTAGTKMGRATNGIIYIANVVKIQGGAAKVETLIKNTASQDGRACKIILEQDPGQAGKAQVNYYIKALHGYPIYSQTTGGKDKITRATPFSAQWQAGNVKILRGPWNDAYFDELESFPEALHDDQVDSSSGAFNRIALGAEPNVRTLVAGRRMS